MPVLARNRQIGLLSLLLRRIVRVWKARVYRTWCARMLVMMHIRQRAVTCRTADRIRERCSVRLGVYGISSGIQVIWERLTRIALKVRRR